MPGGLTRPLMARRGGAVNTLIERLRTLSSGPLCDADKQLVASRNDGEGDAYECLRVMCSDTMKLRTSKHDKMIGIARTVQIPKADDFLSVLAALVETGPGDVLVVNGSGSRLAVAGSLFTTELARRGVTGLVVDGPVRDLDGLACPTYSTRINPYAGTVQHPGDAIDSSSVRVGGVIVRPGDILFGDADGVLVGSPGTFQTCLKSAANIAAVETRLLEGMKQGVPLTMMTNFDEHLELRRKGELSALQFNENLHTIDFRNLEAIDYK
mmetsp:Transcript_4276/g.9484  ORF Transcript_4276/g.9484 Transcript_4276/m.9484 type:complete len:268 (+) Transcript_4276:230-1033(+)